MTDVLIILAIVFGIPLAAGTGAIVGIRISEWIRRTF